MRGRDAGKPILVLVRDAAMARDVAAAWPDTAARLADAFWPGPLTLVVPARDDLPAPLTAGTGTIGVRAPGHAVAMALVTAHGGPVTAPSANPPGAAPPTTMHAVRGYFPDGVAAWIDGGTLPGGASTVAAIEGDGVRVLRAGPISETDLHRALART